MATPRASIVSKEQAQLRFDQDLRSTAAARSDVSLVDLPVLYGTAAAGSGRSRVV